jgi:hypothetical protein
MQSGRRAETSCMLSFLASSLYTTSAAFFCINKATDNPKFDSHQLKTMVHILGKDQLYAAAVKSARQPLHNSSPLLPNK